MYLMLLCWLLLLMMMSRPSRFLGRIGVYLLVLKYCIMMSFPACSFVCLVRWMGTLDLLLCVLEHLWMLLYNIGTSSYFAAPYFLSPRFPWLEVALVVQDSLNK